MVTVATRLSAGASRVLHVVTSLGEDSAAIDQYVAASGHLEHWLITSFEAENGFRLSSHLAGVLELPPTWRGRLHAVADAYEYLKPSFVHAHSASAGAYVRLNRRIPTQSIIYSPHGYMFERRDISLMSRTAHVLSEYLLATRAATVAATSPREAHLAARLHRTNRIIHVPHVAPNAVRKLTPYSQRPGSPRVAVGMGKLCAQTDPEYFATAAATAAAARLKWVWIGEGEQHYQDVLRDAGVHVTGRLDNNETAEVLAGASVFIHTAAWEGNTMPLLLQAAGTGLPVVARQLRAMEALQMPDLAVSPAHLASLAVRLSYSRRARTAHRARLTKALDLYNATTQASRLAEAYSVASTDQSVTPSASEPMTDRSLLPVPAQVGFSAPDMVIPVSHRRDEQPGVLHEDA